MSAPNTPPVLSSSVLDTLLENFETYFEGLKTVRKTVFVFSGHGTEWIGMGRVLLEQEPVFRQSIEACAAAHEASFPAGVPVWNILKELQKPDAESRMGESLVAHPCLVALEIGLVDLLRSRGIRPDAVVGHSVGEVAAAYCAGYLDIPGAFKAVHYQTEVMDLVRGKGRMLFVAKPVGELEALLYRFAGKLSIAAVNSHGGAVISGTEAVLQGILKEYEEANVFARMLKMDIPFHSHTMMEYIDRAPSGHAQIAVLPGALPFYSTVTGEKALPGDFDGTYWAKHISEPVLFAQAIDLLVEDGHNAFIEIGPHAAHGKDLADAMELHKVAEYIITGTLRRGSDDELELAAALAFAHTRGFPLETAGWPERARSVFEQILHEFTERISADQAAGHRDPASWKGMDEATRREAVLELIQTLVQKVAKVPAEKLADQDAGFMSLGINSIMSIQLKELLAKELDLSLPNTLIFDYPSQTRLADFLSAQLGGLLSDGPIFANRAWKEIDDFVESLEGLSEEDALKMLEDEVERIGVAEGLSNNKKLLYLLRQEKIRREPIAIVGMACRMPGGANDVDGYWRLLAEGRDGTGEIPTDRWNNADFFERDKTVPGKSYVQRGGFLRNFDPYEFDPFFFKISPKEALGLDPQQRL
ncbi:MAG: acyltransferase domain-containing protein, partial [Bacteroidetes bacterium]|nr:acyltransferase domain-containing protein [Bacteroidota bacterium]